MAQPHDSVDLLVYWAKLGIRKRVWEAKQRLNLPNIRLDEYFAHCAETDFSVEGGS